MKNENLMTNDETATETTTRRAKRTLLERVEHNRAQVEAWTRNRLAKVEAKIAKHRADIEALEAEREEIRAASRGLPAA